MLADRQARRGGASDPVSQGRPRSEERGMSCVKTFARAGSAVALLATGAIAHQAQPAPQVQPQPRPQILPDPAASPLPATQALFDGYIRSDKMPGIVGAFGVGDLPTVLDRKSTRRTPVTNAHLVCRLLLEKKNKQHQHTN